MLMRESIAKLSPAASVRIEPCHSVLRGVLISIVLVGASGCVVGPDYQRPEIDSPSSFRFDTSQTTASLADLPWWEVYTDETLGELIRSALINNYEVRIAVARVEQARAVAQQAKSEFFPSVGYSGGISRGRNEFLGSPNANSGSTGDAVVGALSAAWEIDVWGRIRRLNEAALAEFLATEEAKRGVMLSLVSEVAQAYLELLELDMQLEIARDTTDSFGESLHIFQMRLQGGVASNLETSRAEAALASTAAQIPELERQIGIKENQIRILLGQNPAPVKRGAALLEQQLPAEIPAGLPSDLLERRPDIRQAEQSLRSANAQGGVAGANFFPQIGLTTFLGKVSNDLSAFTSGASNAWSIGASLTGPIFQGGALRAEKAQAVAVWDEARLRYEQTALNAFGEVSEALISREKFSESQVQWERSVLAYEESVKVATQRYVAGKASYYEVLEAQQQLFPAQNALAQVLLNQRLAIVQLYKALGGGWQLDDADWVVPLETSAD
jgi:multidrug efflux system outer membrane protein